MYVLAHYWVTFPLSCVSDLSCFPWVFPPHPEPSLLLSSLTLSQKSCLSFPAWLLVMYVFSTPITPIYLNTLFNYPMTFPLNRNKIKYFNSSIVKIYNKNNCQIRIIFTLFNPFVFAKFWESSVLTILSLWVQSFIPIVTGTIIPNLSFWILK